MYAMELDSFGGELRLRELPTPVPEPGEVLVRVRACGLCGSDLKIIGGKIQTTPLPIIPGHEFAGDVVDGGDAPSRALIGKRVVSHIYVSCLACAACREGAFNRCANLRGRLGFELPGGLAEYVAIPSVNAVEMPIDVDYVDAAVAPCAMLAMYHAIARGKLCPGDDAVVLGVGGLGIHGIQFLAHRGIGALAVDLSPAKLDRAQSLGAAAVMTYDEFLRDGAKWTVVLDNVGQPGVTRACLGKLARGGRYVMVAYSPGAESAFDSEYMHLNETHIMGTRNGAIGELRDIMGLLAEGAVKAVVDRRLSLREANVALQLVRDGATTGRVVISHDL